MGKIFGTIRLAKWKTATQMISIATILFASVTKSADLRSLGEVMLWFSSVVAIISGLLYCRNYLK
jgi:phosphatidylglycerophosphate synthase